ncbi:MAG: hypothetical protein ACYDCO_11520 [Armatimonadota bacterium]
MPSHFTLRMQFGPHQDPEEVTRWLLKLKDEAPVDEVMVFFFAEEMNDGHDTLERIDQWIAQTRPWRQALREAGVAISLNPWHSMLHTDRGRRLKPGQDWQPMVGPTGQTATAMVCPLDPDWQAYYAESMRRYAAEQFRVIWIDDDIRYHNHGPLEWGGCFCPLHVAEFNRRAGTRATREEIVAACTAPGAPHPWRQVWMDVWQQTLLGIITNWREIVEAEGCRLGLMSSGFESHGAEGRRWAEWWQAFSGDQPPIHRPHFWGYSDMLGSSLPHCIALLDQNRQVQPESTESGPEIENFPYGRWHKSFRQTGAQMALAHILGSTNLNISLYDFMGNAPDDEPQRAEFLRRWRPACDWLADTFPMTLRSTGVGLPWSEDMGRRVHTESTGGRHWFSLVCPHRGWAGWLGAAGASFTLRPAEVNALCGAGAWAFSDDEIQRWLAGGLLLDGPAAAILIERGFGPLIGLRDPRFVTQDERLYAVEHTLDPAFGRIGAEMNVNTGGYAARLLQGEPFPGARVAGDLRGPTNDVVGHGLALYENTLGGRVAVVPWDANAAPSPTPQRVAQLLGILRFLDPAHTAGRVDGGAWLVPQFLTDGHAWRAVVWNASPDEVDTFTLLPPAGIPAPQQATQVTGRGERFVAQINGNTVSLARPLYEWEFVILQ